MTTANLYLSDFIVDREPAKTSTDGRGGDPQPFVMNPFARRPLGKPLSRRERLGVLLIYAFLASFLTTVVVRADRSWSQGRSASTENIRLK